MRPSEEDHILNYMVQYSTGPDRAFSALSDPTRRGILERLAHRDASISELALDFKMTLTGVRKHVRVLEGAGLVVTGKLGRRRTCRVGPRRLADEATWIARYHEQLEERFG